MYSMNDEVNPYGVNNWIVQSTFRNSDRIGRGMQWDVWKEGMETEMDGRVEEAVMMEMSFEEEEEEQ